MAKPYFLNRLMRHNTRLHVVFRLTYNSEPQILHFVHVIPVTFSPHFYPNKIPLLLAEIVAFVIGFVVGDLRYDQQERTS
jgi:hypothetical protein